MARRRSLLEMYRELKEAGATDDFPNLLGNVAHKKLMKSFNGVVSGWSRYALIGDLVDFKTADRIVIGEAPDLLDVAEGGPYNAGNMPKDDKYQIQAKTVGREWMLTRKAIINDDLNGFMTWAAKYGRAASRTIAKQVVSVLQTNGLAYDGVAMFAAAHANTVAGDLTADDAGIVKLGVAIQKFRDQTDPRSGEKISVEPKFLVVPTNMETIAKRLITSTELRPISTSGGPINNPWAGKLEVVVEPFLTISSRCYVMADPNDLHAVEVGFLNGKQEPDLLLKKPDSVRIMGGGDDPWGYDFDDMCWKIRHDWAVARAYYQAVVAVGGGIT